MADFLAVPTNKVQLVTFPHVITASYMTGGAVVMGVALWLLMKHRDSADADMYRRATRIGAWVSSSPASWSSSPATSRARS